MKRILALLMSICIIVCLCSTALARNSPLASVKNELESIILTVSQDKTVIISLSSDENMHHTYWKTDSDKLYTSLLVELDA